MKNTVIKVLTKEHGKEVIKYWKSLGIDTRDYTGEMCKADADMSIYYGVINGVFDNYDIYKVTYTQTTIIELPTTKQQETMRTIKYNEAQSIIDIACNKWKDILFKNWGKSIVLKKDIEISEEEYQGMRKACTEPQNELFDKIFGEYTPQFKIGDWIMYEGSFKAGPYQIKSFRNNDVALDQNGEVREISFGNYRLATVEEIKAATVFPDGTPCLVRDSNSVWHLRYADGKGEFYMHGQKSGKTIDWNHSIKLDMDNLPVNE